MFALEWHDDILCCHYTAAPGMQYMDSVAYYVSGEPHAVSRLFTSIHGSKVIDDFWVYPVRLELL